MGKPFSMNLRSRALDAVEEGMSCWLRRCGMISIMLQLCHLGDADRPIARIIMLKVNREQADALPATLGNHIINRQIGLVDFDARIYQTKCVCTGQRVRQIGAELLVS